MADLMVALDENTKQVPNVELSNKIYTAEQRRKNGKDDAALVASIVAEIKEDSMAELYGPVHEKFGLTPDAAVQAAMTSSNATAMEELDAKIADAVQNAGDSEVVDGMFAKARHLSKTGSWAAATAAYDDILKRAKLSSGKKIDATMEKARIAIFLLDFKQMKALLSEAKKLIDAGGDWDRRNRLKVYEALYLLASRDLLGASTLLLECVATFTCVELTSYNKFMAYTVLANVLHLPRVALKKGLIANPHVISVLRDIPTMALLMQSLYSCDYAGFFRALPAVHEEISEDRCVLCLCVASISGPFSPTAPFLPLLSLLFLTPSFSRHCARSHTRRTVSFPRYVGPHATYIIRECRILAYSQFLEAYRSVTLTAMAREFAVSAELLDSELSRFIAAGRLNAKVDKVGDIIETSRPDLKNVQYQDVIKKGDVLLNQIQKLVRVVDI
jgi:26S proteasome regulatory subunit N7